MNNKKKLLLLVIAIIICVLVYSIIQVYAKYLSSASGSATMNVARWDIKVNNRSIKNNTDISSVIVPVFPGNSNIAANVIAPTAEGYFDLNLDFSTTDVSFRYDITLSVDANSSVQDLVATGYSVNSGSTVTFSNTPHTISDTVLHNSGITSRTIRVFIKWDDNAATQTMSNSADTLSTKSNSPALYKVDIAFTQITDANTNSNTNNTNTNP